MLAALAAIVTVIVIFLAAWAIDHFDGLPPDDGAAA